jgi:hypothetical protein
MNGERYEEEEEETVVSFPDAIVHPRTMMIEFLDTIVANGAMRASWGTVKLTGVAPLHSNSDSTDFHILVQRSPEIIFRNFRCLWVSSGIKKRGKGEVHYDE